MEQEEEEEEEEEGDGHLRNITPTDQETGPSIRAGVQLMESETV